MVLSKITKQIFMTAFFAALTTATVFAADMGQASGTGVNVRAGSNTSAEVLGKISQGTEYEVLDKNGNWYEISYNNTDAYVSADYFTVTKADATITGSGVNLRAAASTSADSLGKFAKGDKITVTGANADWVRIQYQGNAAYVSRDYVSGTFVSATPKIENATVEAAAESLYGVVTADGGLKLRKEASTVSKVLEVLPYGTEVTIERVGQEWVRVVTDGGQKGYVSAEYLSVRSGTRTTRSAGTGKGAEVIAYAKQFIGTPYVWGGTNLRSGVDCSGFVYAVMRDFGITLNRSSAAMASNGVEVSKSNLQAGDLVFFNSGGNSGISHVGIYCGDGTYIHSTDGKAYGVTVTNLNSGYSANTYVTARRVLR